MDHIGNLSGKKILLAVTGSIAAYKTPQLLRLLIKAGAEVKVIMTKAATDFVSPLVMATLSGYEVLANVADEGQWHNHAILGRWADIMLITPCSANSLAKLANGLCDNILQAVYLSATCPIIIAPAMDEDMWYHQSTKNNINTLISFGNTIIPVENGELASGLSGPGRMAEPETIYQFVSEFLDQQEEQHIDLQKLKNKTILITAGPTFEAIDPVRFIGNHSSGKMGVAIAQHAAKYAHKVILIAGPGVIPPHHPNIQLVSVTTALEMQQECEKHFPTIDLLFMAAAVADYRPKEIALNKIKKGKEEEFKIALIKNPDILANLGKQKTKQILVGFALETENALSNAQTKLISKNVDFIALNSLSEKGTGFGYDTNELTVIDQQGNQWILPFATKEKIALQLLALICEKGLS